MNWFLRPLTWLAGASLLGLVLESNGAPRLMEDLGRGLVGVHQSDGKVFLSWRLLGTDPEGVGFNIYRRSERSQGRGGYRSDLFDLSGAPIQINSQVVTGGTWFLDYSASLSTKVSYFVRPVVEGKELQASAPFEFPAGAPPLPYITIPLRTIERYAVGDGSVGDLDGDGEYEIVVIQNGRARDNSQAGMTDPAVLQAYKLDGTFLWQIQLGPNIRAGAHYSPFVVYDLDCDGRAEVACKTADGTIDGKGSVLGDANAKHVDARGHIVRGPEFLTVFDGATGAMLATANYVPARHPAKQNPTPDELKEIWGDGNANRSERYLACAAYLDGIHPSLVMCRGYYTRSVLAAWDYRDGKLTQRWVFDSDVSQENRAYRGQGNHNLSVADVDGDGRDEIVYGAAVIDDNGKGLYSTGWGHGDALHVSDHNPANPGLEIFSIQERFSGEGMNMRDARAGRPIFTIPSTVRENDGEGPGRGASFNIDPRYPGSESWAFGAGMEGLRDANGKQVNKYSPRSCNFAVWWDGDLLRELLDRNQVSKWDWQQDFESPLLIAQGQSSVDGSKAAPVLSADILGDWREEIIWRSLDGKELRLYTTTHPTKHRLVTLMHDPQYRLAVAWQNAGYNQPPHPSFYLDEAAPLPKRPSIAVVPRQTGTVAGTGK